MFDIFQGSSMSLKRVHVEITTRCTARCVYCPSTLFSHKWREEDMTPDTFRTLAPVLAKTDSVFFHGWGEPLLNPAFFDMVGMARKMDCRTGLSTNGMMVDNAMASKLVNAGLEEVRFFLAGTDKSNDRLREGTYLDEVLAGISELNRQRTELRKPSIRVFYQLFRSGLKEIGNLPELLKWRGIDRVDIHGLDYVPSPELAGESLLPVSRDEFHELDTMLDRVKSEGESKGLDIRYRLYRPGPSLKMCTEKPDSRVFVSASGELSPCVLTGLPIRENAADGPSYEEHWDRLTFGNINHTPPDLILGRKPYRKFRDSFRKNEIDSRCAGCPRLYMEGN